MRKVQLQRELGNLPFFFTPLVQSSLAPFPKQRLDCDENQGGCFIRLLLHCHKQFSWAFPTRFPFFCKGFNWFKDMKLVLNWASGCPLQALFIQSRRHVAFILDPWNFEQLIPSCGKPTPAWCPENYLVYFNHSAQPL